MATAPVTSTPPSATGTASKVSATTSAAEQEDRFMKLLVAQMKNQDPLNPMDNAQMTSQIAQINTVGGIEKLNTTVTSLLSAFTRMQAQSATDLTGRQVLVEGDELQLQDGRAQGGVLLESAADKVAVEILDKAGQVVATVLMGATAAGSRSFEWDGRLDDGTQATDGSWRMRAVSVSNGGLAQAQTLGVATVRAITQDPSGAVRLDLGKAGVKSPDAIRAYL
jgi:flagellar basal-body rod modification protein FlgD